MRGGKWTVWGMTGALTLLCSTANLWSQTPAAVESKPAAVESKPAGQDSKAAASVNGELITMAELEAAIKQREAMPVVLPEGMRKQLQQEVLNALIAQKLMRQFLKQQPPIEDKEIDRRMSELVYGLQQQNRTLADFCRECNQTPAQIRESVASVLQWQVYAGSRITDKEVLAFYQNNKDMFDKVLVHAAEIMFRVPAQASPGERDAAKAKLKQLREQIVNKQMDFALAAKQYSNGQTKDMGGDLDWFPHIKGSLAILPEQLQDAAFALPPGQISEPIDTDIGVHIVKVIDRKPGEPSDFNKIKDDVRQLCIEEMQQTILQQERQKAKIEIYLPH